MNASPRILQIFSRYLHYGGEEGSVHRIAGALREGFQVDYFSHSTDEMLHAGVLEKALMPWRVIHNAGVCAQLRECQLNGKYDFWQIHNVFPAISPGAYDLAFKMDVPVIHYLHNYKFGCVNGFMFVNGRENRDCIDGNFLPAILQRSWHHSYLKSAVMAAALTRARQLGVFERITRWIAISHAQKEICVQMGIPADRIDVIHHFLDAPERRYAPVPRDGYALFIGRLSPEKGVDRLLSAWKELPVQRKLVVVGEGPVLPELQRQADQLGLSNVEFRGFVPRDQHAAIWDGAAFSVVPSVWQEPFGMVVLEAWAQGRPVVAHRIGALPEIVADGENGFLAPADNTQGLAQVLETAFNTSPDELMEMGRAGEAELRRYYMKARWMADISATYRRAGLIP